MLRMKRKPLVNLREWGKKNKLDRNTMRNAKPISEPISPLEEEAMTFPPPANEPPSPTYIPAFSPLEEEEEDEVKEAITTHTTMEVKTIDTLNSGNINLICSERDKMKLGGILKDASTYITYNYTYRYSNYLL